jgi:diguanylate cyclase (GGDEF)-like protein
MTSEHLRETMLGLDSLLEELGSVSDGREASRLVVERLCTVLGVPVAMLQGEGPQWTLVAEAVPTGERGRVAPRPAAAALESAQGEPGPPPGWTGVPLGPRQAPNRMLLLYGDAQTWREDAWLPAAFSQLSYAVQSCDLRESIVTRDELLSAVVKLSVQLMWTGGVEDTCRTILETVARTVRARLGSLAVYDPREEALRIKVTHGYPLVLVEHLRIGPGESVMGAALVKREPILVREPGDHPGLHRRLLRYRTPSFMAVPLVGPDRVLAVLALADREDNRAFDTADLRAACALGAPAAQALTREELTEQVRMLGHQASIDPLTGLFNRGHFEARLEGEVERVRRHGGDLALLMLDLDDFKIVNDTLGHPAGDEVLRMMAEILRRSVRVFDVCTRYGGDEFAILMPGSGTASVLQTAERIRSQVERHRWRLGGASTDLSLTVTIGMSAMTPSSTPQDLLASADQALYRAKADGKNRLKLAPATHE